MHPTNLEQLQKWEEHGFTVIELLPSIVGNYYYGDWQNTIVKLVLERLTAISEKQKGREQVEGYDAELAQAVLFTLNKTFPRPLTNMQLKQALDVEPSDEALLSILEGLQIEGLITGKGLHESTTSHRRLVVMANIQLTAEGRKQASGRSTQPEQASIVHQYISHAPVGAMGPNSTGTINYYQQWEAIEKTVDLSVVALQLEQLRVELQKTTTSREDHKQLGQIADAEEHAEKRDGPKVLSILSAAGSTILTAATKIGADQVVKLLAEHWKH